MHLWEGKNPDEIPEKWQRVQPCDSIRFKNKKDDPYWQKRLCEECQEAARPRDLGNE